MIVIPAVLTKNAKDFSQQITKLKPYFKYFQIDIADNQFVPNKTVQIEDILKLITNNRQLITDKLTFDFHLMVNNYNKEIKKLGKLRNLVRIKYILIHYSTHPNFQFHPSTDGSFGLVLNPEDQVKDVIKKYNISKIPSIQIMSVSPGFQGAPFVKETLHKIEELRQLDYKGEIFLDGAVNDKTIPIILSQKFKPDVLGIGSFLSKAENLEERIKYLKTILKE